MGVNTAIKNGIAEIVLDCPPVNALNSQEWLDLAKNIDFLSHDDGVKVILISAAGKGFCAGADVKELQEDPTKISAVNDGCWKTARAIHVCNVPVISACHGFVLGGGILLAGASDILLATTEAYFGLPEIDRGALGGGAHLSRLFPLQAVRKMMFTGKPISAQRAYEYGSIESLHENIDSLHDAAMEIASDIASKSSIAMNLAKKALNQIENGDVDEHYKSEQTFTLELYKSKDSQEARDAFVEKRDANFNDED
ncbi:enoyl-CoA hydratase family protein [Gammaproteobacteria bacterium]|nr:enoyl-CoA hydratase family protein [Gammaproteobacteria bacterium]MDC1387405.1 enoyl-CoA hydratase family protein [Gammaproteobacteria bacterium]